MSRREWLRLSAGTGLVAPWLHGPNGARVPSRRGPGDGPIIKPLPPELFVVHESNAEMRWEAMRGQGYHVPNDRFFVRDHTETPLIDVRTWRLRLFGSGCTARRAPSGPSSSARGPAGHAGVAVRVRGVCRQRAQLLRGQQDMSVPGTPWRLGGVGVARWRGVPLATVLERAGLTESAVDVLPRGLDPDFVDEGVNHGRVRRPLPVVKALQDVLLAYEMNGHPLPPDHGFPVRLVVPSWVDVASIKWVGDIEVSDRPLISPWNEARLHAGRTYRLRGRSWSGHGWTGWEITWRPERPGRGVLMARATDESGNTQPAQTPFNRLGYLFGAVVRHPVTVA
ncbi:MAG: molybdopterin-dependent oxidoreductase [Streptosporangiales bacterium]|nr:molybdopterin-dependent oxidoreductase [Streptosporangiales bacterium]